VAAEADDAHAPATRWERLLDLDGDLAEALGEDVAARARDRIGVATVRLERGSWLPESLVPEVGGAFALLVCDGLIVRELDLAGTLTADLIGPGDIVAVGQTREHLLSTRERWHVSGAATIAILDSRVLPALHAWPALGARLIARGARQAARAAEQRAISQLPRVELRIRALLWHLAERWGRMGPAGVVVPIELTHTALGHLIGARRSTVTLALGELSRLGAVVRRDDGAWVLRVDSNPSGVGLQLASRLGVATIGEQPQRHPGPDGASGLGRLAI
jgi:CRP/FNR family transcriptional regulator, cyclic AMP receptor protein